MPTARGQQPGDKLLQADVIDNFKLNSDEKKT